VNLRNEVARRLTLEGELKVELAEPPPERKEFDLGGTIKDSFAIVASAATVIYLISQIKK
jgi:hypothetical protein